MQTLQSRIFFGDACDAQGAGRQMQPDQAQTSCKTDWAEALMRAAAAALSASAAGLFAKDGSLVASQVPEAERVVLEPLLKQAAERAADSALGCAVLDAPKGRVLGVAREAGGAFACYRKRRPFEKTDQDIALLHLEAWRCGVSSVRDLEDALSASRRDFALSAHLAQFGMWSFDVASQQLSWSDELYQIHEIDPLEQVGWETAQNAILADHRADYIDAIALLAAIGQPFDLELPIQSANGLDKWLRVFGEAEWRGGVVVRIFGFAQDITDHVMMRDDMTLLATRDYLTEVANRASFTKPFFGTV